MIAKVIGVVVAVVVAVAVYGWATTPQLLPDDEVIVDPVMSEQMCDTMFSAGLTPEAMIDYLTEKSGDPRPVVAQIVNAEIAQACPWFGKG